MAMYFLFTLASIHYTMPHIYSLFIPLHKRKKRRFSMKCLYFWQVIICSLDTPCILLIVYDCRESGIQSVSPSPHTRFCLAPGVRGTIFIKSKLWELEVSFLLDVVIFEFCHRRKKRNGRLAAAAHGTDGHRSLLSISLCKCSTRSSHTSCRNILIVSHSAFSWHLSFFLLAHFIYFHIWMCIIVHDLMHACRTTLCS